MKTLLTAAFVSAAALSAPAIAQHSEGDPGMGHAQSEMPGHGMMMMQGGDMEAHQEQMARMRELMTQARETDDPEARQRLMAEHQELMHARMESMMGADGRSGMMMHQCMQRMTMMHDMMQQMMAQDAMQAGDDADAGDDN